MARKPARIKIVEFIEVDFDMKKLTEVIDQLQKYVEQYGSDAYFDYDYYGHDGGHHIRVKYFRLETDPEYEKRCQKLRKEAEMSARERDARVDRERKEYERLKKKFGGK